MQSKPMFLFDNFLKDRKSPSCYCEEGSSIPCLSPLHFGLGKDARQRQAPLILNPFT